MIADRGWIGPRAVKAWLDMGWAFDCSLVRLFVWSFACWFVGPVGFTVLVHHEFVNRAIPVLVRSSKLCNMPAMTRESAPWPTARQNELVSMVAKLGPVFAKRAVQTDIDATFPTENFADLASINFLALCIPEENGGLGADFATYALVAEEIGRHCGSTALTFNMHTATMLLTGEIADMLDLSEGERTTHERRRNVMYQGVVEQGHIHAQPFSEGISTGATTGIATTATPVEGGYLVNGRKIFASLAPAADRHNVICVVPGTTDVRFLSLDAEADGITIEGDWNPLGMRGTVSMNLVFNDVFVPSENELLPPGAFDQAAERFPYFYMTLSFAYVGLMRGMLDFTESYLRGDEGPSARRDVPAKQFGWAEMQVKYEQARGLLHSVIREAAVDPSEEALRRAWVSVLTSMDFAPEVASLAIRVCGGRSLLKNFPLERMYRDARCGATMLPWGVEVIQGRLATFGIFDTDGAKYHAGA